MDNSLIDNFKHKGLRDRLMYELVDEGIKDTAVLFAIHKVPRHYFFPPEFAEQSISYWAGANYFAAIYRGLSKQYVTNV